MIMALSCQRESPSLKIKGSDTEVNLVAQMAEAYHLKTPGILLSISGGGSGLGIASLLNGTADLANSSRAINPDEIRLFQLKGIRLDSFVFAQDAIAFVVSDKLDIDSLGTEQLGKILDGTYRNWSELSFTRLPINIYGRQSNSGTYDFIREKLGIRFSSRAKQMSGNAQILEAIKSDPSGIGYVGAGYLQQGGIKGIKVLSIRGHAAEHAISPLDRESIHAGRYFFQRPLYQYFITDKKMRVMPFLAFEQSPEGKEIILQCGYYPIAP